MRKKLHLTTRLRGNSNGDRCALPARIPSPLAFQRRCAPLERRADKSRAWRRRADSRAGTRRWSVHQPGPRASSQTSLATLSSTLSEDANVTVTAKLRHCVHSDALGTLTNDTPKMASILRLDEPESSGQERTAEGHEHHWDYAGRHYRK